ncbi:Formimidoyltransferase-cyclodeaminase [Platysternon megacephalum]|uniref:Formimidoyltransferase-cyclodeaminase n=1 Tax=Platysternon megacephalum TaxID=55544 RepID=A0A4D9DDA8_9SAUR|nr:Formimidoyltransferase-cyclodeaminase [Platysternon megacephalum]
MSARQFLIAYNITLNTRDKQIATDIAFELREKGRVARKGNTKPIYIKGDKYFYAEGSYPCGNDDFVGSTLEETAQHCQNTHGYDLYHVLELNDVPTDERIHGRAVYKNGMFSHAKAIGWYVPEFDRAQISINLTDYTVTSTHDVLEAARELAAERGVVVTGSEIVGLVPFQALYESGQFYLRRQGKPAGVPVRDVLNTAIHSMGLRDVAEFDLDEKVLGLPKAAQLVDMKITDFADEVSRDTPAPGGGSIAALCGALGASLASMVATLTYGSKKEAADNDLLADAAEKAQIIKDKLIVLVDADTDAFNGFMDARRLPQDTDEQKQARHEAMQAGLKEAIEVPYQTALASFEAMQLADVVARKGKVASITDGAVGVQAGFTGVRGGCWNVSVNLKDITDKAYVHEMQSKCDELIAKAEELLRSTGEFVDTKLKQRAGLL